MMNFEHLKQHFETTENILLAHGTTAIKAKEIIKEGLVVRHKTYETVVLWNNNEDITKYRFQYTRLVSNQDEPAVIIFELPKGLKEILNKYDREITSQNVMELILEEIPLEIQDTEKNREIHKQIMEYQQKYGVLPLKLERLGEKFEDYKDPVGTKYTHLGIPQILVQSVWTDSGYVELNNQNICSKNEANKYLNYLGKKAERIWGENIEQIPQKSFLCIK